MSLTYQIVKENNDDYELQRNQFKELNEELLIHKEYMRKLRKKKLNIPEDVSEVLSSTIRKTKAALKKSAVSKTIKKLKVNSPLEWLFYNEFIDDECGLTRYDKDNPVKIKAKGEFNFKSSNNTMEEVKLAKEKTLAQIKEMRKSRRELSKQSKKYYVEGLPVEVSYDVYVSGGNGLGNNNFNLHMVPGEILRLQEATKLKRIFEPKKPKTKDNHVGIEIECLSKADRSRLAEILHKHKLADYVFLTTDGSLRKEKDYPFTHELTVLIPEKEVKDVLRRVIDALDEADCRVNSRCGLHVHLDMRNRNKDIAFNNLVKSQKILFDMNPAQRKTGQTSNGNIDEVYSRPVEFADFTQALNNADSGGRSSRYMGINPHSFSKHQTIEVRIHSGSTNYEKIYNWICILVNIVTDDVKYVTETTSISNFCERYQLNDTLEQYITMRTNKFKSKDGAHITIDEAS